MINDFRCNFQQAWAAAVPLDREGVVSHPHWRIPWRTILAVFEFAMPLIFVHIDLMIKMILCIDVYRRKIKPMGEFLKTRAVKKRRARPQSPSSWWKLLRHKISSAADLPTPMLHSDVATSAVQARCTIHRKGFALCFAEERGTKNNRREKRNGHESLCVGFELNSSLDSA